MEIMDPANLSSTSPPFRLLDLPLELQRIVFGHALHADTTLRKPKETKRDGDVLIYSGTNILRVSSRIKEETLPIFYQVNHFHCEQFLEFTWPVQLDDMPPLPPIFLRSFHMIRHISMHALYDCRYRGRRRDFLAESVLANALIHIERHAPNLRTLAIQFAPLTTMWALPPFLLVPVIRGSTGRSIITALRHLHARLERLSLVYFGERRALDILWSNIAPLEDWTARILDSWPVTISPVQIMYLKDCQDSFPNDQIRVWELSRRPEFRAGDQER